jgi:hypothetical protein
MKKNKNFIHDSEESMQFDERDDIDDDQYLEMLRGGTPRKEKYDFTADKKYVGEKRKRPEAFQVGEGEDEEITLDEDDNVVELKE